MVNVFKISITEKAKFKLDKYYKLADKEVGGLFEVEINDDEILIVDTLLMKQEVSGGDFKLDEEALSAFSKEMFIKYPDKMEKFKGWWHKHPITGWSGHDDNTFETLLDTFGGTIVGLVYQDTNSITNKKDKILCRIDKKDERSIVSFNTLDFTIIKEKINRNKLEKFCEREYKKKVKEKIFEPVNLNDWNQNNIVNLNEYDKNQWWRNQDNVSEHNNLIVIKAKNTLKRILEKELINIVSNEIEKNENIINECNKIEGCTYCEFFHICNAVQEKQEIAKKMEVQYYDF